jgi:hypothetical protein
VLACSILDNGDEIGSSEGVHDANKPRMTAHLWWLVFLAGGFCWRGVQKKDEQAFYVDSVHNCALCTILPITSLVLVVLCVGIA